MNLKRFTARTPRDALALVRQAFGDDAVVMSTKPCPEGVEVLAMAPESLQQLERVGAQAEAVRRPAAPAAAPQQPSAALRRRAERIEPTLDGQGAAASSVDTDVQQLEMSTLSFQDYVRDRMLKRRQAEMATAAKAAAPEPEASAVGVHPIATARARLAAQQTGRAAEPHLARRAAAPDLAQLDRRDRQVAAAPRDAADFEGDEADWPAAAPVPSRTAARPAVRGDGRGELGRSDSRADTRADTRADSRSDVRLDGRAERRAEPPRVENRAMLDELRSMRGLIEQRFGALAFMEKMQRHPRQAQLAQRMLELGFSPGLTRKLAQSLPDDVDETAWSAKVLEHNLITGEHEPALEDAGGVFALIGATGVGKTTSTAKLAAAFATRHGAANLGLITLDAYRVAAHEQLRTYGRILGVPVHTAHDRASLEDLLDLLSAKRMVLIDTAGVSQRDNRTRELLDMLQHRAIQRLVVVNAAAQGETIEEQLDAYALKVGNTGAAGVVLSKVDEAVKLGPALDAVIRARLKVLAVANGQRVPEDWHRLSSHALVQRALRCTGGNAWRLDPEEVSLVFTGLPAVAEARAAAVPMAPV